jgi:hypothetical protein
VHDHATNDVRQECEGKTKHWIQEDGIRRLKGPVFFFHVNHHNGRQIADHAMNHGGYHTRVFTRWDDVEAVKQGKPIQALDGYDMFQDKSWTDLEDTFETHTLDDLVCGGPGTPRIFVTSARHPVENLLSHEAYFQANIKQFGLMQSCESDNIALRLFAGKVCHGQHPEDCQELTRNDLEIAKVRARNMDVIFILEHFPATIKLACARLGWHACTFSDLGTQHHETYVSEIVEQLDEEPWNQLFKRNKLGIEFYEYLKQLSFDMLKEEGLDVPTEYEQEHALPVLKSLQDANAIAVPYHQWRNMSAHSDANRLSRWQC